MNIINALSNAFVGGGADATKLPLTGGTLTGQLINTTNGLGLTPSSLLALTNTTAASAGSQQVSPMLTLVGNGWKTNATAASQTVAMGMHVLPVQGATAPTGELVFSQQINGGSLVTLGKITRDASNVAIKLNNGTADLSVVEYAISGALTINSPRFAFTIGGIPTFLDQSIKLGYLGNLVLRNGAYTSSGVAVLQMGDDHATTATNQTLKAHNVTTGTGADLILAGGTGSVASGNVRFGTHTAIGAETVTGFITIKDEAGNVRKLAVVS